MTMKTIKIGKRYVIRSKENGLFIRGFGVVESIVDADFYPTRDDAADGIDDEFEEVVAVNETVYLLSNNMGDI